MLKTILYNADCLFLFIFAVKFYYLLTFDFILMDFKTFDNAMKSNKTVFGNDGHIVIEVLNLRGHSCIIRMIIRAADSFISTTSVEIQMKTFQMIESNSNFNWYVNKDNF